MKLHDNRIVRGGVKMLSEVITFSIAVLLVAGIVVWVFR